MRSSGRWYETTGGQQEDSNQEREAAETHIRKSEQVIRETKASYMQMVMQKLN